MQANKMNCLSLNSDGVTLYSSVQENNEDFLDRLRKLYPCVDDVSQLPQGWSPDFKASPLGLTKDNLTCYYRGYGPRYNEKELPASVRTEYHIPPSCLLYYFEIRFVSKGRDGFMGLGITTSSVSLNKLPGKSRGSYGYHADDGNISFAEDRTIPFGPTFVSGDVIGCGYNLVEGKCFFTKNGLNLGKAFDDIPSDVLFYPTVGMKTIGEEVYANFGQEDFVYDIEQDLRSLRKGLTSTISEYPISDFGDWEDTLHKLVQSWLIQNSYPDTAAAFKKSTKLACDEDMRRLQLRNRIQQLVLSGDIGEAISLTNSLCPNLLQDNPNLLFTLKCRQFIEMISGAENGCRPSVFNNSNNHHAEANDNGVSAGDEQKLTKLILFGQELFDYLRQLDKLYGRNEDNEKMLLDAIGLIAFTNPKNSYYSKLLDPNERERISQLLNRSILKVEKGSNYRAPMEDVMDHLRELVTLNNAQGRWLVDQLY